jgi:hypothetical protein
MFFPLTPMTTASSASQSYLARSAWLITIGSRGPMTEVVGALRKKNGRQPAAGISPPISRMCLR